ncbi:complement C1q tumor necrosis factor-related protein 1 isoform X2 [Rousettus aegyptiacus]|uniref:complement C1q tumor necrosis factor-related protein 1 isoform X2 n=1 Tax=Rousettus aegyptiacus TaxID=9407 RepID=UPI000789A898|nr:complement C1q tumor necrosis factor-related protein 1 isoform X2 [Rousettus aegyptiacus]
MCWERSREARGRSHLAGVRASRSVRLSSACPDFGETAFPLLAGETSEPRRSRCPRRPPPSAPPSRRTFSVFPALSSSDKSLLPPTWPGGRPAAGRCSKRRCRGSPEAAGRAPAGGHGGTMGSGGPGLMLACCLLLAFACGPVLGRVPRDQQEQQEEPEGTKEPLPDHTERAEEQHEKYSPRQSEEAPAPRCYRCCDPGASPYPAFPAPQINLTILKGEKGDRGDRGLQGKYGKTGSAGARGHAGPKGQKGSVGAPGDRCKNHYAAFSVGRKKPLHSNDYYQTVIFDTEFVNLYGHFNMFTGKFYCYVPGIYFFSLNVHTWNQKETYLHIMKNEEEAVILYAQVSDRSIMQSQSLMLELRDQDEVWVRLFKGERENAIFSDEFDTYITFSGYLVKHAAEP